MPKLNVQQTNQNVIQAFKNALAIGNLKGIIASDGNHNFSTAGSNRNLLDNPWFTVRQRGDGPFTAADTVGIDRWKTNGSSGSVTGNSGYVSVSNAAGATFYQRLRDGAVELGETYTASIMENDGTISTGTVVISTNREYSISVGSWLVELDARAAFAPNYRFMVYKNSAWSGDFKAMKLEKGAFSTLANDAPPEYAEELAKCQYYCRVIETSGYFAFGIAAGSAHIQTPLQYAMRARPSVSFTGSIALFGANDLTVSSILVSAWGPSAVCLDFVTTGATSRTPYIVNMSNAKIVLSADL